jgi:putative sterol carrier protein
MARWSAEGWDDRLGALVAGQRLPEPVSGSVAVVVAGGPSGSLVIKDGQITGWRSGEVAPADATLTLQPPEAEQLLSGEVEPSVAFMRGRLKASGDMSLVLALLRATSTDSFRVALADL